MKAFREVTAETAVKGSPVKHGYTQCARDYPFSSFARCVREGLYEEDWGCLERGRLGFEDVQGSVGVCYTVPTLPPNKIFKATDQI
jgi:hypothetical protein